MQPLPNARKRTPGPETPETLGQCGSRWPVEECFEAAKNEAGLDNYQVRLYHAWYRHVTLSMLALTFLAVIRAGSKKGTPGLWTTSRD
jgi:SRSO17 transposase